MVKISILIITILVITSAYQTFKSVGMNSSLTKKGYGKSTETIGTLLDRIQWSNHYLGRIPLYSRYMFYSIIITFFVSIIYCNTDSWFFLQNTLVICLILITANSYFSYHADKFPSYYIDKNIKHIRKKLKLEPKFKLSTYELKDSTRNKCYHFIYRTALE